MEFGAHVHSLSALAELRAALLTFEAEARDALCQVDLEIRRFLDWLGHDMVKNWQAEIRRREDLVAHAKADLERARLSAAFGDEPDCTDQKVALARAKRRLAEAEEYLRITRRWLPAAEKEATDYRGPTQQLVNFLDADIPAATSRLERMLAALEGYIAQQAPQASSPSGSSLAVQAAAAGPAPTSQQPQAPAAAQRTPEAQDIPATHNTPAARETPEAQGTQATQPTAIAEEPSATQDGPASPSSQGPRTLGPDTPEFCPPQRSAASEPQGASAPAASSEGLPGIAPERGTHLPRGAPQSPQGTEP